MTVKAEDVGIRGIRGKIALCSDKLLLFKRYLSASCTSSLRTVVRVSH